MEATGKLKGERVALLGMARSGLAAARLCLREGAHLLCLDLRRPPDSGEAIRSLESAGARFVWGPHPATALEGVDLIIKSPGVPSEIDFLSQARRQGIPIWSELELASRFARGAIYGITGTNGKSTTAAWAADMLDRCHRAHELVGNIGRPISDGVMEGAAGAILVTEISSFQLEETEAFRPKGAVLLNLTADHLNRHGDLASYREAEMRIFQNQAEEDHAVVGEQEGLAEEVVRRFRSRLLRFRLVDRGDEGASRRSDRFLVRFHGAERRLCGTDELALPGMHNQSNALAALALLAPLELPEEGLIASLRDFAGLPHRLELVRSVAGVRYVNDSKATNTDSLETALRAFDAGLVLLAGGQGKEQDFRPQAGTVRNRCRRVVLFGESADLIRAAWGGDLCEVVGDLGEATHRARDLARSGEIVLLSPACASFDQFRNYEERGEHFRCLVQQLARDEEDR